MELIHSIFLLIAKKSKIVKQINLKIVNYCVLGSCVCEIGFFGESQKYGASKKLQSSLLASGSLIYFHLSKSSGFRQEAVRHQFLRRFLIGRVLFFLFSFSFV